MDFFVGIVIGKYVIFCEYFLYWKGSFSVKEVVVIVEKGLGTYSEFHLLN